MAYLSKSSAPVGPGTSVFSAADDAGSGPRFPFVATFPFAATFPFVSADGGFLTASPLGCLATTDSTAASMSVPLAVIHAGSGFGGAASASAILFAAVASRSASSAARRSSRSRRSRARSARLASFSSGVGVAGRDAARTRLRRVLTISRYSGSSLSMPSFTFGANLNPASAPSPSSSSYFGARDMATRMARIASSATPSSSGTGISGTGIEGSLTSTAGSFTFGSSGTAIFFGASAGAFLGAGGGGLGLAGVSALGGGGLGFAGVGAAAFGAVASGADSLAGDSAFFFSAGAVAACGGASSTPGPTQKGATALARRSSSSRDAFNAAPSSLDLGPSARSRRVAALAAAAFRSYATLPPRYSSTSSDSDMPVFSMSFTAPESIASIFGRVIAAVSASWDGPGVDAVAIASDRVLAGNRRFRRPRLT